ncbi:MAG: MBL fold metallo-hydrolase [Flavobacteriaceae bacterium]|nr:MAG: MBL fold metallo-hydrolase [Flavobacteriaceae bacterium]
MSKLIFLGTGTSQGIPVIGSNHPVCLSTDPKDKRLRSSVLIQTIGSKNILVDCGPDFRTQMLRQKVDHLEAILFTHSHNDHMIGLDDIRPLVFRAQKDMPIYGLKDTLDQIRLRFPYVYSQEKYPGVPGVVEHPIQAGQEFQVEDMQIRAISVMHGNLPILGYKFGSLAYLTDVKTLPEVDSLKGLDVLVISCLRLSNPHHSHLILSEALEWIEKINPQKTYLTHISHHMGFHAEVQNILPPNVLLAYDGLEISF